MIASPPRRDGMADWLASRLDGPMEPGAVAVAAPVAAFQAPGGGEYQLYQTARHLDDRGVRVRPLNPWTDRIGRAGLLHLFGMSREGLELARVARAGGVPVVLSPICWFSPRAALALAGGPAAAARDLAKLAARLVRPRVPDWRRRLLGLADRVLPNSEAEARQLRRLFGVDPRRLRVVPNGAEPRFLREGTGRDRDYVLFVGRVEPRKNLLGLIRALRGAGLPLAVVGAAVPGHEGYEAACRRAGDGFVEWRGRLDHDDPRLEDAYAGARVLALPSWFETPGLVALEAALAGCALAVTPHGSAGEYFGALAEYAPPGRPAAIRRAVVAAWGRGPRPGLRDHVRRHYLWGEVARRTAEVYDELLS